MIGRGLMLLSLDLIGHGSAPLSESATLQLVLAPLADEPMLAVLVAGALTWLSHRSEEHTSELQSLMRISSAVFCLKKQTESTRGIQLYTHTYHMYVHKSCTRH